MPIRNLFFITTLAFTAFALVSCQKDIELTGVNKEAWKNDRFGCQAVRTDLVDSLLKNKEKIVGESEGRIIRTLGKPDKVEIFAKNVKQLLYYTEPGPECNGVEQQKAEKLVIEINSLGKATLVYLQNQ